MALRDLVEGDCGGPSPLIRLTSHFVQDHGLKEEGVRDMFGSADHFESSNSDQLVKQFLEESAVHPQTFKMENLLQEMRDIEHSMYSPVMAPGVVEELTAQDTSWANQYLQSGRHFDENHTDDIWNTPVASATTVAFSGETHELGLGPKWAEEYLEHSIENVDVNNEVTDNLENPNFAYSKFMKFMRQDDVPVESTAASSEEKLEDKWAPEFIESKNLTDTANKELEGENNFLSAVDEELAAAGTWVEEFTKADATAGTTQEATEDSQNHESSFWARLQGEWDKISSGENISATHPWISEYESFYDPFKEYSFHEENPMLNMPHAIEEGKKRLETGDLPGAVLCFEAAVKQDNTNAEAWLLLGKTQAENEHDPLAISALKQCLSLDPTNSAALMALAVSYTNESYQRQACLTLKDWLLKNEKYKHLTTSSPAKDSTTHLAGVSTVLFHDVHEDVKSLFIQAARMQPHNSIDADIQCGLGVLFNLSNEYDKAADCFLAALQARPEDPKLWNRLGATLANGQRSEEAIDAYFNALKLSPGFIRARYNLGISCISLSAYREAGEHLLTALNQQAAGKGVTGEKAPPRAMSDTIWSTMRLVLSLMRKHHLTDAVEQRDLVRLNKEFEME